MNSLVRHFAALLCCLIAFTAYAGEPRHVGRQVCAECHAQQASLWSGSHHDLAMQEAGKETVLGDFSGVSVEHFGTTSSFYMKDGRFMVRTEGGDGELGEFEVRYAFGVEPLQQYLVELPDGYLQALSLAWDTRDKAEGGQRWFHLYPDEKITPNDELHWTRVSQNWNSQCAECHSTALRKNYDPLKRSYSSRWSEIDVSCEACHGPGSAHVGWARREAGWQALEDSLGLAIRFDERDGVNWDIDKDSGNAVRSRPSAGKKEIEACARCHARRSPISEGYVHGEPLMDHYMPRLLDEGMYHADGQIDDEVYVYGSFLQSRMHAAGVTCSDCHEPHSLGLRAPGNGVCLQCHASAKYDSEKHHFHPLDSAGASCVECHMPPKTYMVVDPRHDHSMRIPRPDLTVVLGAPNACNTCHTDRSPEWAAGVVEKWYEHPVEGHQRYAQAFAKARRSDPGAAASLAALVGDTETPDIARATALALAGPMLTPALLDAVQLGLWDGNPLLRAAAVGALENAPATVRVQLLFPMLDDPVRAVRIEVARVLADIPAGDLDKGKAAKLEKASAEYLASQHVMSERPEAQVNIGNFHAARGDVEKARGAFREAVAIENSFMPAYINLADLERAAGNEKASEVVLRQAISVAPENGLAWHALGLALVRQQRTGEGLDALQKAVRLEDGNARFAYVYAVALHSTGKPGEALLVLQVAHAAHPADTDILAALVAYNRDAGNLAAAEKYASKLRALAQ